MGYKVFINYILVKLKIRSVLPTYYIDRVRVDECNEELVRIDIDSKFVFDERMKRPIYLRKNAYKRLCQVGDDVGKDGYVIKLFDAYRSIEEQVESWNKRLEQTRAEHPDYSKEQLEAATSLKVAMVQDVNDFSKVGGHQTGGAVDITLLKNGKEIDMGTAYEEYSKKTITKNNLISDEQKKNRMYLVKKMKKYDFSNFPAEWWHFSYGDRMWAAYNSKKKCFYGYAKVKN